MNHTIIVCAGKSQRMNTEINKILISLDEKSILYHSIKPFEDCDEIDNIILVSNTHDKFAIIDMIDKYKIKKLSKIVVGGKERQDSVYNGLIALNAEENDIVLVHNGANPFINKQLIREIIKETEIHDAVVCGFPAENTIKVANGNIVIKTLPRETLWEIQTPQSARYYIIKKAFDKAYEDNFYGTDDAMLIERLGYKVKIVKCQRDNFKITTKYDLEHARLILNSVRVGIGMDSHRFSNDNKQLILGGLIIPDEQGLIANSDGDVILHALTNAISSAIGGNSLGFYADKICQDGTNDSKEYIKVMLGKAREIGYAVNNVGISIECKRPLLRKYEDEMKSSISRILNLSITDIGINVTSGEELTEFGKGKGIQVFAIVGLKKA